MPDFGILMNIVLLSTVASLGTGLGGLIAIIRRPGMRLFGFLMGITAGVMISLAFMELVNEAWQLKGFWTTTIGFGLGAICMFLLDFLVPHIRFGELEARGQDERTIPCDEERPHHRWRRYRHAFFRSHHITDRHLFNTGILLALGITLHNLPEGIAVGAGYLHQPVFGLFIAMAIMLHNIPEGVATALPLFRCGVNKWEAFRTAFLSGLAEPVGALLAALFLTSFQELVPGALAFAGGVMVFITLDELIPTAREFGHQHYTAFGIIVGTMFVFVLSGLFGV